MTRSTDRQFDVVVVGAGPAGIAAAVSAAREGRRVALVDDNPAEGGQIWRAGEALPGSAHRWIGELRRSAVVHLRGTRVFDHPGAGVVAAEKGNERIELRYGKLILATGARELFLPFPGWTLPGICGAGGLDAMARGGLPVSGKRVVVAGTGPLLLAVAAHVAARGAKVVAICEQAPLRSLIQFAGRMLGQPAKLAQGIRYRWAVRAPMYFGCWPIEARGDEGLQEVTLRAGMRRWTVACDFLACGFHLVPNTELAQLIGCRIEDGLVAVDEMQRTSVENVLCAGEPTGIGGVEMAVIEGQIAGFSAAGAPDQAGKFVTRRRRMLGFVRALRKAYALDPELRRLASDATIVCRCEDVVYGDLRRSSGWRDAKLQTRCGMGPCQGRICGAAAEFLFGWRVESVRPPAFPVSVANLTMANTMSEEFQEGP